eukprot:4040318-Pyramimonas_sp.AAC.1
MGARATFSRRARSAMASVHGLERQPANRRLWPRCSSTKPTTKEAMSSSIQPLGCPRASMASKILAPLGSCG